MSITTDKTQPVLVGGLVMGVLSALPPISLGNVCCCLWVICGGAAAAYLLQQNERERITAGDGALIGLYAGLAGAVIAWAISIPIKILLAPMQQRLMERILESTPNVPPEFRGLLRGSSGVRVAELIVGLICWLFVGAIFSTLGGALGAVMFQRRLPPATQVPPSS